MVDVSSAFDVTAEHGRLAVAGRSLAHILELRHRTEDLNQQGS